MFPSTDNPQLTVPLTGAAAASCRELSQGDSELTRVVEAWPQLPEAIRRAVLALVGAAGK